MKVKTLLKAHSGNTRESAEALMYALKEQFQAKCNPLSHLNQYNDEAYLEGDQPFVRFEIVQELGEHYATAIRPEVRDGKFVVTVVTHHFLDGKGMSSQSWKAVEGLDEDLLENLDHVSFEEVGRRAKRIALANHAELIQRVCVPRAAALKAAKANW
ncbi:hypothetical protein KTD31_01785 [Burkholderia multivorans]|jgi:hypothetical protein|uniref:hypothetical protein n=1 Tax=Burkholderia multivorans TaxID=87883 RepID=UPI001C23F6C8|nr:hypothetical protein [Burkholderia multivorans]MBU9200134.1 hypothetical protein [Burkholderia multivorans]MDN8078744.1 hypothetical protein [Burkholderia multivorans]